jgi:hypothetical protein
LVAVADANECVWPRRTKLGLELYHFHAETELLRSDYCGLQQILPI